MPRNHQRIHQNGKSEGGNEGKLKQARIVLEHPNIVNVLTNISAMSTWPLLSCTCLKISDYNLENSDGKIQLSFYDNGHPSNKFLKFESIDLVEEFALTQL